MKFYIFFLTLFFANFFSSQNIHFDNKKFIEGEMLVQVEWKKNIRNVILKAPLNYKVELVKELSRPMRIFLISFDHNKISHKKFQSWLYKQNEVTIADYNYKVDVRSTIPNDPSFTSQWHHVNSNDADIDSDLAWDITTGGTTATNDDIVVCMLEGGGGNLDHSDLTGNRWVNSYEIPNDNIDNDGNGYVDDYNGWNTVLNNDDYGTGGHGTNCLGMIGAKGNNGSDVAGANWDVKMMVVNMGSLTQASVISAYTYPLVMRQMWNNTNGSQGAFVVATSASWGIDGANPSNYPLWCQFYDTLGHYGILNVGATTNQNLDVDVAGDMPTGCTSDYMIGVGRTGNQDQTAGGYGDQTIQLGAPGINVVTTNGTSGTTTTTGTSFSCPLTAGVIALAYSIPCPSFMTVVNSNPQNAADLVLQSLLTGTDPKPQLISKFITGGRLNSFNTINNLMATVCSGNICLGPNNISVNNITDSSATLNFNSYSSATETIFYFRESGSNLWDTKTNVNSPVLLDSLSACSIYEFSFQSVCGTDTSNLSSIQTLNTLGCGNCVDLSYCSSSASDGADEWIESIDIGSFSYSSGNNAGYGDFISNPNINLDLNTGQTYSLTITPGWAGTLYNEQSRLWIDLDQDGSFNSSELLFDQGLATQTAANGSITIPSASTSGTTRMRIQMAYIGGTNTLPGVCDQFTWGEVEDYCVNIVPGVICGMNVSSTVINPACLDIDNGSISVSVFGGAPGYSFNWGNSFGTSPSLTNLSPGSYNLVISDSLLCDTIINYDLSYLTTLSLINSSNDISCYGLNNGSVSVIATGGSGYLYDWGTGYDTTNSLVGLSSGIYSVNIIDSSGCMETTSFNIIEPPQSQVSYNYTTSDLLVYFTNTSTVGANSWEFGDGTTSSSNSPFHTYSSNGTYNACLNLTTNCGTISYCSDIIVFDSSSVGNEKISNNLLEIYPNPTSEKVSISTGPYTGPINANVYDLFGRKIFTTNLKELSLKSFANGVYILVVKIGDNTYTTKIIKE
tara:strand:+ start:74 stop:3121 length:3048 start_codon:yes stop_codon:yes gene_type:complete